MFDVYERISFSSTKKGKQFEQILFISMKRLFIRERTVNIAKEKYFNRKQLLIQIIRSKKEDIETFMTVNDFSFLNS